MRTPGGSARSEDSVVLHALRVVVVLRAEAAPLRTRFLRRLDRIFAVMLPFLRGPGDRVQILTSGGTARGRPEEVERK